MSEPVATMATPHQVIKKIADQLQQAAHVANPAQEAEWILLHVLKSDRLHFWQTNPCSINEAQTQQLQTIVANRIQGQPLQHLLESQPFCGLDFKVNQHVLIPRPETEYLVELVQQKITAHFVASHQQALKILDIGAGSGAISLSLAHLIRGAQIEAIEPSPEAFQVLQTNWQNFFQKKLLQSNVKLLPVSWDQYCGQESVKSFTQRFDVVVSNPPYIDPADAHLLPAEVLDYEPHMALFSADNGNAITKQIIHQVKPLLSTSGFAILELNEKNADQLLVFAKALGWQGEILPDLTQKPRFLYLTP